MNEKNYIVTCLTYKRKDPKIFTMLREDKTLTIYFGVRREELNAGFYEDWKTLEFADRIKFIPLDNVIDAGDTRQKILDWCYDKGYKYVVQFDDTVRFLRNTCAPYISTSSIIRSAIDVIEAHDKKPIGFVFDRPGSKNYKIRKTYIQAWIIDVQRLHASGVKFRCVKDVGWDDFVFSWEVHNAGYFTVTDPHLIRFAKSTYPWANEAGGTHVGESFDVESMIAKNNARCVKAKQFLEETFGAKNVSIRKLTSGKRTFDYVHADWQGGTK